MGAKEQVNNMTIELLHILHESRNRPSVATPGACELCQYRQDDMRGDGHCYMFRDKPLLGSRCVEFRDLQGKGPNELFIEHLTGE